MIFIITNQHIELLKFFCVKAENWVKHTTTKLLFWEFWGGKPPEMGPKFYGNGNITCF